MQKKNNSRLVCVELHNKELEDALIKLLKKDEYAITEYKKADIIVTDHHKNYVKKPMCKIIYINNNNITIVGEVTMPVGTTTFDTAKMVMLVIKSYGFPSFAPE